MDIVIEQPFAELALLLIITAVVGALSVRLRQPVLIAYIIVGILVGPAGLHLVKSHDQIALLAQMGVAVLLFLVGLKLDLRHVRHIGPVALATGLGQLTFTIVFGFILILLLGIDWITAAYVAVALTFSSTIIIVKLLSDKREIDSLHGRIAVGFLIVQDLAVVLAMMTMSAWRVAPEAEAMGAMSVVGSLLLRIGLAAVLIYVVMRYVLPRMVRVMARSQELLLIFAIAWGISLAALGEWVGFSQEAGAFIAGFTLASTQFRDSISARLTGVRDFLLLFFFIDLGAKLEFSVLGDALWPALVLSAFVLIGNPIIVMAIMGYMGYRKRTSFLAGLTVAQISEFSIVFVAMGITLGHVGDDALGLTTLVGLVTITLSTYMILYSQPLYERLSPLLGLFERKKPYRESQAEDADAAKEKPQVILFGMGRYGARLQKQLERAGIRTLGIDFDPEAVHGLQERQLPVRFGDAEDPAFIETLPLAEVAAVVSALPSLESNRLLLQGLRENGFAGTITVVVRSEFQADALRAAGVKHINPFFDAADLAAQRLAEELSGQETSS